jgi:hypothetical protein
MIEIRNILFIYIYVHMAMCQCYNSFIYQWLLITFFITDDNLQKEKYTKCSDWDFARIAELVRVPHRSCRVPGSIPSRGTFLPYTSAQFTTIGTRSRVVPPTSCIGWLFRGAVVCSENQSHQWVRPQLSVIWWQASVLRWHAWGLASVPECMPRVFSVELIACEWPMCVVQRLASAWGYLND